MPYFNIHDLEYAATKSPEGYMDAFMRRRDHNRDSDHVGMIWLDNDAVEGIARWKAREMKTVRPPRPPAEKKPPPTPRPSDWEVRGPLLWAELHRRAMAFAGDVKGELAWLENFSAWIGCGECREHWERMVKAKPPDLSSRDAYFAWTVARHNEVNRRLSGAGNIKREWTVEESRELYTGNAAH